MMPITFVICALIIAFDPINQIKQNEQNAEKIAKLEKQVEQKQTDSKIEVENEAAIEKQ